MTKLLISTRQKELEFEVDQDYQTMKNYYTDRNFYLSFSIQDKWMTVNKKWVVWIEAEDHDR